MIIIAIYGVNGSLGKHVVGALLREPFSSKIAKPIRLVTSTGRETIQSPFVKYYHTPGVSFNEAFNGADVVINLGQVPFSQFEEVLPAVIANKIPLYFPSQFGCECITDDSHLYDFLGLKVAHSKRARENGIKTVDVYVGFHINENQSFVGSFLPHIENADEDDTVDVIGDESTRVNPTFYSDIGNTLSALITQHEFKDIPDTIKVYSSKVTIGDVIDHYENLTGKKLKRNYVSKEAVLEESRRYLQGDFRFENLIYNLRALIAKGEGGGLIFEESNDREFVNPNEKYFKWKIYKV